MGLQVIVVVRIELSGVGIEGCGGLAGGDGRNEVLRG